MGGSQDSPRKMNKASMVFRDFNEILYHYEKKGGRPIAQCYLQAFSNALGDCNLTDMSFSGDIFTWQRGKIREHLDRGVSNAMLNELFLNTQLVNGEMTKSNHRPLIVNTDS